MAKQVKNVKQIKERKPREEKLLYDFKCQYCGKHLAASNAPSWLIQCRCGKESKFGTYITDKGK